MSGYLVYSGLITTIPYGLWEVIDRRDGYIRCRLEDDKDYKQWFREKNLKRQKRGVK